MIRKFGTLLVVLLILGITGYRFAKIIKKAQKNRLLAESVIPEVIWDISIPDDEFLGDQSQVGNWMFYVINGQFFKRDLVRAQAVPVSHVMQSKQLSKDPQNIGFSANGKKTFRIEMEDGQNRVVQYHVKSHARGLLARLPESCSDYKAKQQLLGNFFALEANCWPYKRIFVINLEFRRLTYASPRLPLNTDFLAFSKSPLF